MIVTERLDAVPVDDSVREVQREESLLHQWPNPEPMNIWHKYNPIGSIHLPLQYTTKKFQPPQAVFESKFIHIEYQNLQGRQPFYHRNVDVDEISYHAVGKRQVLTEIGCVNLEVGDMARIPVGVGHDNHAEEDVHILFYIPQDVTENIPPYRTSEYVMPPYEGWKAANSIEFITDNLGSVGSDLMTFYTDEQSLLDNVKGTSERMQVVRSSGVEGLEWLYKSENIWLGFNLFSDSNGKTYTRHRKAEEVQIQVKGTRWLITQRGTLQMEPGDTVNIPLGTAFTSVAHEENKYITVLMRYPAPAKKDFTKMAEPTTLKLLEQARN